MTNQPPDEPQWPQEPQRPTPAPGDFPLSGQYQWPATPSGYQQPPDYGPPLGAPRKKKHTLRNVLLGLLVVLVLFIVIGIVGAALGIGKTASNASAASSTSSAPLMLCPNGTAHASPCPAADMQYPTPTPTPAPAPLTCAQQIHAWINGSGGTDVAAVTSDLGQFSQDANAAAASGDYTTVESDMTQLSTDSQTLADNLPAPCVKGLDYNLRHAMGAFEASNVAFQMGAAGQNASLINQATSYMAKGTAYIAKATNAIKQFNGG